MFDWFAATLRSYPEIAIFLALGLGYYFGKFTFRGIGLGAVTATLLAGVLIGQLGITIAQPLKATVFLMFLFAVGYAVGPQFVRGVARDGLPQAMFAAVQCVFSLVVPVAIVKFAGYDLGYAAGFYSGSQTLSAAMGLSTDAINRLGMAADQAKALIDSMPVAYAVTYMFGTVGSAIVIAVFGPALLRIDLPAACKEYEEKYGGTKDAGGAGSAWHRWELRAFRVKRGGKAVGLRAVEAEALVPDARVFVERIRRDGKIEEATADTVLREGDVVAIVGAREVLVKVIGAEAQEIEDPELLNVPVEGVDVYVTNKAVDGKTLAELGKLSDARGVFLRKITRGATATAIPILPNTKIERGDILTVVGRTQDTTAATNKFIISIYSSNTMSQYSSNLFLVRPQTNTLYGTRQSLTNGTIIVIDQLNDFTVNAGGSDSGIGIPTPGELRPDFDTNGTWSTNARAQMQVVVVQSITGGTNITFWPPLMATNWQARLIPQIWWWGSSCLECGIENLGINCSQMAGGEVTVFSEGAYGCYASNCIFYTNVGAVFKPYEAIFDQMDSCGAYDMRNYGSGSYGTAPTADGFPLFQNNWFFRTSSPMLTDGAVEGGTWAYNYSATPYASSAGSSSTKVAPGIEPHFVGGDFNLFEGNFCNTAEFDFTHGSQLHFAVLRNQADGPWNAAAANTVYAMSLQSTNWYFTLVGNVLGLGRPGFYTNFLASPANLVGLDNNAKTILKLGFPNDVGTTNNYDFGVQNTLIYQSNWDSVNSGTTNINGVTNTVIPNSYYLSGKPAWWGSQPWPPIGPDLSPMTNKLPAQLAFEAFTNGGVGPVYGVIFK